MRKGFTLLELFIVIAITVMISALAISYKSSTQQQIGLYVEVQKLAELILRAKSLAISTYNNPGEALPQNEVICGYGVNIDYARNGYELFSYRVNLQQLNQGCEGINTIKNNPPRFNMVTISSHDVAPGVVILDGGHNDSIYKVFFVPPNPVTLIGTRDVNGAVGKQSGKIYLTTKDASLTGTIYVSEIGQVDF